MLLSGNKVRTRPTFSETDYALLAAFRHELREFLHFSEEAARAAGVRPQQHQAMLVLRGFPKRDRVTVGQLSSRLKIQHHSAVELVNRMEAEDLIIKGRDPDDGRRVLIRLTPHAKKVLRKLSAAHCAELTRVGPALKEILTHLKILL